MIETKTVRSAGERLQVEVRDDGIGAATARDGHGLQGLADRVTLSGGTFVVDSPPGGPTSLVACIPMDRGGKPFDIHGTTQRRKKDADPPRSRAM